MSFTLTQKDLSLEINELILRLIGSRYSFAVWRVPNTERINLIIEVDQYRQKRLTENWELENLTECFIINAYDDSHPPKPLMVNADIIMSYESGEVETSISPRTSGTAVDEFYQYIKNQPKFAFEHTSQIEEPADSFINNTKHAIENVRSGTLQKVVMSRSKDIPLPTGFHPYQTFRKAAENYPNAFCYLTYTPEYGTWMGATPERLITIEKGRHFRTDALAGTQTLHPNTSLAEVAWRQKEIEEQAMVTRYIISCFKKIRLREYEEIGPRTTKAGNLAHLRSTFTVDMEATQHQNLGSVMLDLLHPTSAVCGFPREAAHAFIKDHESFERELFAGFLGPVNIDSATRLFVNLRCMKIDMDRVRLYAGAGITSDSDPEKEFEETNQKMNTLLSVLLSK
ncbi:isochorismate synthase [Marinoscillum sp. MHG1-6]|uniref:isochorismate synthase n=1 Tax=Marinoscillum sp. MHG1-6 TaxID=2959627 RepID=UPI002158891C|nr:isochorismate synthase [Marinoscillum sp. MHG1-6]